MDFFKLVIHIFLWALLTASFTLLPGQSVNEEPVTEWIKQTKASFVSCATERWFSGGTGTSLETLHHSTIYKSTCKHRESCLILNWGISCFPYLVDKLLRICTSHLGSIRANNSNFEYSTCLRWPSCSGGTSSHAAFGDKWVSVCSSSYT